MFNFFNFNRPKPEQAYVIVARSTRYDDCFRRFIVVATSDYEACRDFDQSDEYINWARVSNASLEN